MNIRWNIILGVIALALLAGIIRLIKIIAIYKSLIKSLIAGIRR